MSASLEDTSPFNDSNHENNQDGGKVLIGPDDGIQKTNQPTENDEINFVDKGFDSGWLNVQGLLLRISVMKDLITLEENEIQ